MLGAAIGSKKGFTMVELLIVLAILAILAGVVALSLTMYIGRGEEEACRVEKRDIEAAVFSYYHENLKWPTDEGGPGDIDFTKLMGDYLDDTPASDESCLWQIAENGAVVPGGEDCPCD